MRRELQWSLFCVVALCSSLLSFRHARTRSDFRPQHHPQPLQLVPGTLPPSLAATPPPQSEEDLVDPRRVCGENAQVMLLFPHVNKAGGRSVEATFRSMPRKARHRFVTDLPRTSRGNDARIELVDGHRSYDELARALKCRGAECERSTARRCTRWVFMLRDPEARMLSAFYATKGRSAERIEAKRRANPSTIHFECERNSLAESVVRNASLGFEAFAALPSAERARCGRAANVHVRYLGGGGGVDGRGSLERAVRRLAEMAWFGVVERFDESWRLLDFTLGLGLRRHTPVFNLNTYDKQLSPAARSVLREMNHLDNELYSLGLRLFERRLAFMRHATTANEEEGAPYFVCDGRVRCWDKLDPRGEALPREAFDSARLSGEAKEDTLCAPVAGCVAAAEAGAGLLEHGDHAPSSTSRCVASFLIVGARKGGTTSLYQYISRHPRVRGVLPAKGGAKGGAQMGEVLFFRDLSVWRLGGQQGRAPVGVAEALRALRSAACVEGGLGSALCGRRLQLAYDSAVLARLLPGRETDMAFDALTSLSGESSVDLGPACAQSEPLASAASMVRAACGEGVRVVYLVRDPIERAVSQWKMRQRLETDAGAESVEASLWRELRELQAALPAAGGGGGGEWWSAGEGAEGVPCLFEQDWTNALWSGLYVVHLERWRRAFGRDRLLVLQSEAFFAEPAATTKEALVFLGLDAELMDVDAVTAARYNTAAGQQQQPSQTREDTVAPRFFGGVELSANLTAALAAALRPYALALNRVYGIDISAWPSLREGGTLRDDAF